METIEQLAESLSKTVEEVIQIEQKEREEQEQMGRFGKLWVRFMIENYPQKAAKLKSTDRLYKAAIAKNIEAAQMKQNLVEKMKESQTPPSDFMERVQWENQLRQIAEEVTIAEILSPNT